MRHDRTALDVLFAPARDSNLVGFRAAPLEFFGFFCVRRERGTVRRPRDVRGGARGLVRALFAPNFPQAGGPRAALRRKG